MYNETSYEVKTYWGRYRLDEGAYRDYLAGKLWLNWVPKGVKTSPAPAQPTDFEPITDVSKEAIELCEAAAKYGVYNVLREYCPGKSVTVPYRRRMSEISIDEMNLSVRSLNGLKRANAHTFGKLMELMERETGLKGVRNLGIKSEAEITQGFFSCCYALLSKGEKAVFWQRIIDENRR